MQRELPRAYQIAELMHVLPYTTHLMIRSNDDWRQMSQMERWLLK